MRALVTGAAGFIGSHLCERLLADGHEVIGLDAFTTNYNPSLKEENAQRLRGSAKFHLVCDDLSAANLEPVLGGCDIVFHLAAQPGVRSSWGPDFKTYIERNIWATQRLLEAMRAAPISKLVFASSSSVYGNAERYPTSEDLMPQPVSPYGVTKLAGEQLCFAYARNFGINVVALRYFTVYGPRQRPDMAFNRFITALRQGDEIGVYGDGTQTRDFTYVSDTVEATVQAGYRDVPSQSINVGGGSRVGLMDAIHTLGEIIGVEPRVAFSEQQHGDVRNTAADISKAKAILSYEPQVDLRTGLSRQAAYQHAETSP